MKRDQVEGMLGRFHCCNRREKKKEREKKKGEKNPAIQKQPSNRKLKLVGQDSDFKGSFCPACGRSFL